MTTRQIVVGLTAWVLAVGSVASLSWVAIDSAGHDADPHGGVPRASLPAALPPSPSASTPADHVATPSVPAPSPSVAGTPPRPASTTSPVAPTQTTQRNRTSPGGSRSTTTTHRPRWSRPTTDGDFQVEQTPGPTGSWPGAGPDTVPIDDSGLADFEQWLAQIEPAGYSVRFVPWWYGGSGGYGPRDGYGSTDHSDGRSGYPSSGDSDGGSDGDGSRYWSAGYDGGSAWSGGGSGTGSGSGWLRLDAGAVRADCDGSQLLDWSATPWDGWDVRGGPFRGSVQLRFSSDATTVDVQAGCVGDRPAFRYREGDAGEWRTSLT